MAELTPAPGYLCCGTKAPEAYAFEIAGVPFHVHRHVNEKGEAAKRFKNNWQVSHQGIPVGKLVAPTAEFVANTLESMWGQVDAQKGAGRAMECFREIYIENLARFNKVSSPSTT